MSNNITDAKQQEQPQDPIIQFWEKESKPKVHDCDFHLKIASQATANPITETPTWAAQVTLLAKRNMVSYFLEHAKTTDVTPWVFFVLAKHFRLSPATVARVLALYASLIEFRENGLFPDGSKNYSGKFQQANLDPRLWFGKLVDLKRLPQIYSQALENRFTELKAEYPEGTVFLVSSTGRFECQLPKNFHRPLIKHLHGLKMFTECFETCPALEKSPFSRPLQDTETTDLMALMDECDDAVFM